MEAIREKVRGAAREAVREAVREAASVAIWIICDERNESQKLLYIVC